MFQYLVAQGVPLQVWYHSDRTIRGTTDVEFGQKLQWNIPLLDGYPFRFIPNYGFGNPDKKGFWSLLNPGLITLLRKQPKSLVVVHSWNFASQIMAIVGARLCGHRVAFRGESNQSHEELKSPFKRAFKRVYLKALFSNIHYFLYIGKQNKAFYIQFGVKENRLIYTPYCVDNARFQQAASQVNAKKKVQSLGFSEKDFVVLYSGKFIAKKRPLDLLQAAVNIPEIRLIMMGDGPLRPEMEAFIANHQLQHRVVLTGFINQLEIPDYYGMADLFVMCSGTGETWGLSVNEAMNFSLPVVVSNLTGCAHDLVVEGENGFIFDSGNINALTKAINTIYQFPLAQRKTIGARSLEVVNSQSFDELTRGIIFASKE